MNARLKRAKQSQRGYSMIELLIVLGIAGTVMGIAMFQIGAVQPSMKGDGAMRTIMAQLNTARELSISQRRMMQVNFLGTGQIQIVRQEVPAGTTALPTVAVEGGLQYGLIAGIVDTPDGFGLKAGGIAFGTATAYLFSSDGTLIDQNGNPLNGTVFLAIPGVARSFRAVTVMGGTGRIRGYKWDGHSWILA
jgi:prepilin-type N-terminal cleavage/methylation domain-containing protein